MWNFLRVFLSTEELKTKGVVRSQDGDITRMSSHDPDWVPEDSDEEQKARAEETWECLKRKAKTVAEGKILEIETLGFQADVQSVEGEIAQKKALALHSDLLDDGIERQTFVESWRSRLWKHYMQEE